MFGIKKPVWVFFWSFFLFYAGLGLYSNIWPNYLRRLGASPGTVGLLVSLSLLLSTLSYLPGGFLSDRFDRRLVTISSWWVCVPAPLFYGWARHWTGLLPGILLFYLSSFGFPALLTYLSHAVEPREFSFSLGFATNFSAVGMVVSPAIGGYIARTWSFQVLFYVSAALFLASTLVLYLLDPQPATRESHGHTGSGPIPAAFWIFAVTACLLFWGMNVFPPFIPQFLEDVRHYNVVGIGLLGSVGSVGSAVLAPLMGWLAGRAGLRNTIWITLALVMTSVLLFLIGINPILLAVAFFLRGALDAMRTLCVSAAGDKAPPQKRGAAFGTYNFVTGLASSAGPVLGGFLYSSSAGLPFKAALITLPLAGMAVAAQLSRGGQD